MNLIYHINDTKYLSSILLVPERKLKEQKSDKKLEKYLLSKEKKYGFNHLNTASKTYKKIEAFYYKKEDFLYSNNEKIKIKEEILMKIVRKAVDQLLTSEDRDNFIEIDLGKKNLKYAVFAKYDQNQVNIFSYCGELFPEKYNSEFLGRGYFGVVQRVINLSKGQLLAMKIAKSPQYSNFIQNEICNLNKIAKRKVRGLQGPICVSGQLKNLMALITPLYTEKDLVDFSDNYIFQENEREIKLSLIIDLLSGLNYLHNHEIIHGDIKPNNCFINKIAHDKYEASIGDFGEILFPDEINKFKKEFEFGTTTTIGFYTYSDHKLLRKALLGKNYNQWISINKKRDVFALACTIWYLLTRDFPFLLHNVKNNSLLYSLKGIPVKEKKYPDTSKIVNANDKILSLISKKTLNLLLKALDENPHKRPDSFILLDQFLHESRKNDTIFKTLYNLCFSIHVLS